MRILSAKVLITMILYIGRVKCFQASQYRKYLYSKWACSRAMSQSTPNIDITKLSRVYYNDKLSINSEIVLRDDLYHYLMNVMRIKEGSHFRIFNSENGEFLASVIAKKKRNEVLIGISSQIRNLSDSIDLPLVLFTAPIRKQNMKILLSKVTELGIQHIIPVITQNTNFDMSESGLSYRQNLIESSEQCERLTIPQLHQPIKFDEFVAWLSENNSQESLSILKPQIVFVAKERNGSMSDDRMPIWTSLESTLLKTEDTRKYMMGLFCGPEGGFTSEEFKIMQTLQCIRFISLGPTILRTETAAISAIACISAAWNSRLNR